MLLGVKTQGLLLGSNVKVPLQYGKHSSAGRHGQEEDVDTTVRYGVYAFLLPCLYVLKCFPSILTYMLNTKLSYNALTKLENF